MMPRVSQNFWLLIIVIVAAGARLYQLDRVPVSLSWDEVAILVDVKSVAETGHDMHGGSWLQPIFPSWGDYKLPVYLWLSSAIGRLAGVSIWAVRLPSAIAGIGTVLIAALLAKLLITKQSGEKLSQAGYLWTGLVVALAPWGVVLSRAGYEANVSQFLLALSLYLLIRFRRNFLMTLLAVLVGALSVYAYYATRFVWPVVFVVTQALYNFDKFRIFKVVPSLKKTAVLFALPLLVFIVLLQPLTRSPLFAASQQFRLSTPSLLNDESFIHVAKSYRLLHSSDLLGQVLFNQKTLRLQRFISQVANHLTPDFLFFTGDQNLRHGTGKHGLFLSIWLPMLPIGFLWLWTHDRRSAGILTSWWLAALVPAAIPIGSAHSLRSLNALVPASIFVGVGLWWVAATCNNWVKTRFGTPVAIGTIAVLTASAITFGTFWYYYHSVYPTRSSDAWSDGYQQLASTVNALVPHDETTPVLVDKTDGRIPLWFLASDRYAPAAFTTFTVQHYLFTQVGQIRFTNFPSESELLSWKTPQFIIANSYKFTTLSDSARTHLQLIKTVYSAQGTEVGTIARYTP